MRCYAPAERRQLSAAVLNAMDKRIAISGLMPARPFKMEDSVLRLTPSDRAASVTVRLNGARQIARRISPAAVSHPFSASAHQ